MQLCLWKSDLGEVATKLLLAAEIVGDTAEAWSGTLPKFGTDLSSFMFGESAGFGFFRRSSTGGDSALHSERGSSPRDASSRLLLRPRLSLRDQALKDEDFEGEFTKGGY